MDEGEREGGKEEKDGWRWRPTTGGVCWEEGAGGGFDGGGGGCDLGAATCIAAKATVSIFLSAPGD
jgi:hypothetical protein